MKINMKEQKMTRREKIQAIIGFYQTHKDPRHNNTVYISAKTLTDLWHPVDIHGMTVRVGEIRIKGIQQLPEEHIYMVK